MFLLQHLCLVAANNRLWEGGGKEKWSMFHKRCFIRNEWVGFNFFPNYDFFVCFVYEGWCVGIFTGKDKVYPMYLKAYSRSNIIAFDYELKPFL